MPRHQNNAFVGAAGGGCRQTCLCFVRDVYSNDRKLASIKFPNIRAPLKGSRLTANLMRVRTKSAFEHEQNLIHPVLIVKYARLLRSALSFWAAAKVADIGKFAPLE